MALIVGFLWKLKWRALGENGRLELCGVESFFSFLGFLDKMRDLGFLDF